MTAVGGDVVVTLTVEKGSVPTPEQGAAALRDLGLRVVAAVLQIAATVAVLQVLQPTVAGVYFKGFVIAYGLAALLRGKYDLFVAQHFVGQPQLMRSARELVRGLGIRVLIRSAIACAILLVVTTDLDVMDTHMRPYLQTYLPFVLAVPFATLALFLASVLRAVNRTLSSTLVATYSINIMILVVANSVSGSEDTLLLWLSWAFFAGTLLAAGVGVLLTRNTFPASADANIEPEPIAWREVYAASGRNGLTGMALACLQWGPLCLLAVMGTEIQLADYAVVTRTAMVIDFLIPAAILVPHGFLLHSRLADAMHSGHGKLFVDLIVSLATTTLCVAAVAIATPLIVDFYGIDYTKLTELFVLLFATQWLNGVGRPAIRHLAANWNFPLIRRILFVSMTIAMVSSLVGIPAYGAFGAAISVLVGALLLNGQAVQAAFARCSSAPA
jgi:O-antigen/teichoic acid export membrane protein